GTVVRFDGELMHLAGGYNYTPEVARALHEAFPMPPSRRMMSGRAILARDVVGVGDALGGSDYAQGVAPAGGFRSMLAAPMLRDGRPIGAIVVNRGQPVRFSPAQIALLKTFADQAVIAIENVRLFKELDARNRDLTEALEQQTATAEILRVISSSPTDIQPVLDAIAQSAARLCEASDVLIRRVDGDIMRVVAHLGSVPIVESAVAQPISRGSVGGRAILECRTVHIHDVLNPDVGKEYPTGLWTLFTEVPYRTLLVVPLVREDTAIGTIAIRRPEVRPFTDKQIALLQTFADQAVIAIENVRLFTELQVRTQELTRSVGQLTALGGVGRAGGSTLHLETVLNTLVSR